MRKKYLKSVKGMKKNWIWGEYTHLFDSLIWFNIEDVSDEILKLNPEIDKRQQKTIVSHTINSQPNVIFIADSKADRESADTIDL